MNTRTIEQRVKKLERRRRISTQSKTFTAPALFDPAMPPEALQAFCAEHAGRSWAMVFLPQVAPEE